MGTLTAPWAGAQGIGGDPKEWAEWRREQWPDDPYLAGYCLLDQVTHAGRLHVIDATPYVVTSDEILTGVILRQAHTDISMALPNMYSERHDEVFADLEHRRVCGGIAGHISGCAWTPPAGRSTHRDHNCHGADICWHGWVLKFSTPERTLAYRIGDHRQDTNGWEAAWPD